MRHNTLLTLLIASISLLAAFDASSQQMRPKAPPMGAYDDSDQQTHGKPIRERMESLRKVKLLEILELEGDNVERFFAKYSTLQRSVYDAKDALDAAIRALREADNRQTDEATLLQRIADVQRRQQELIKAAERRNIELKPMLSTRLYARYIAFEAAILDDLQRLMMRRIRR